MSRLIAYLCNDDNLTPVAMRSLANSAAFPEPAESGGYGLGWLQAGRTLLRTTLKPGATTPAFLDLMADLHARSIVGHVRGPDEGAVEPLDLQPFRFRRWIFAHGGEELPLSETRQQLLDRVPAFVAGNVKGTSAGEVFGHMFLGRLHQQNLLEGPPDPAACAQALASTIREAQVEAAVGAFAAVAVGEKVLVAGSVGHPLHVLEIRGLSYMKEEPLFAGHKPKPTSHPTFKGVVVTDAPVKGGDWTPIPDEHVMWVDRDWKVRFAPIAEL